MEDPRISRMYASIFRRSVSDTGAKVWRALVLRSGLLTAITLTVLLGGLILVVRERGKGHLSRLQRELHPKAESVGPASPPLGGQDALVLERTPGSDGSVEAPEFVSATMLPGRGMNILQITAMIPSLGKIQLLDSPSVDDAAKILVGTGADAKGQKSLTMGGALEAPWANRMGGVPTPDGDSLMAVWSGQTMVLPGSQVNGDGPQTAIGGLILKRQSNSAEKLQTADGWQSKVVYQSGAFDGHWLSQTELTTVVDLKSHVMEFTVTAKNTGTVAEPIGIGWRPRFALPGGRDGTILRLPDSLQVEMRSNSSIMSPGMPTGRLVPVAGAVAEFLKPGGAKLGSKDLEADLVHLRGGYGDPRAVVEFRDVKNRYGLRMTLLTPTIRALTVSAPAGSSTVLIDPRFNYDDPFGKEWQKDEDTGMVVLQPGESTQWKIRLELFALPMTEGRS